MEPTDTSKSDYFHRVVDCQWACPAHTDVPEYIRLIAQGEFTDAYMVNRESNVFPGILGRVCDRPCEPACRRGRIEEKPVAICRLKRVASDNRAVMSSRLSEATRFSRQMATGFSSIRPRRQAGSQGRSQTRPKIPGNTLDSRFTMYASVNSPWAMRRMYSGTSVCAGQAHWQSTTR